MRGPGEVCDGDDLGALSCEALGLGDGTLACAAGCGQLDTSGCRDGRPPPTPCGDDAVDEGEVCDGADLQGATCETLGLEAGTLRCADDCMRYDPSGCGGGPCEPRCGDRACGPDPVCGTSCGTCAAGACDAAGQCQVQADPSAPSILHFGSNTAVLHEGDSVVFSAIVTDTDGIDDVIGGTLLDVATGASMGAFATAAQEGAYSLRLTWADLNAAAAINVGPGGEERTFRAEFFDQGGLRTGAETTLRLRCRQEGFSACAGACVDLQTDRDNCGRCGNRVVFVAGRAVTCRDGALACSEQRDGLLVCGDQCLDGRFDLNNCGRCGKVCDQTGTDFVNCRFAEFGGCLGEWMTPQRTTCANLCPRVVDGGRCAPTADPGRAYYGAGGAFDFADVGCDEVPPADHFGAFRRLHCYCVY